MALKALLVLSQVNASAGDEEQSVMLPIIKTKLVSIGGNWLYKSIRSSIVFLMLSNTIVIRLGRERQTAKLSNEASFVTNSKWKHWDTASS